MRVCSGDCTTFGSVQSLRALTLPSYVSRVPFFSGGVCIVHVKTRSPILAGNDPASLLSCLHCSPTLLYHHCNPLFFPGSTSPPLRPSAATVFALQAEPRVVLCQLPARVPVKHSLSGDTRQSQEAALGANQAENPLIPVVTIRRGMLT